MSIVCYGDSITVGVSVNPASQSWVNLLTPDNNGVSGDQAAEVSKDIQAISSVNTDSTYTIMVGTNDHRQYKNDVAKQGYFEKFLRQAVAWLALPSKVKGRDAGMTYTGTWTNTAANTFGKNATSVGATALTSVSGDSVYIGYIIQNAVNAKGVATVEIDGVSVGTLRTDGSNPSMNTINGSTYAAACERFTGLGAGIHTVRLTLTSAKLFYLDYIAGSDQADTPKILLSNIIEMTSAGYVTHGTSAANVSSFNALVSNVAVELNNDGANVVLINNHASIDPLTDLTGDGVHPNNFGHKKIYDNFKNKFK